MPVQVALRPSPAEPSGADRRRWPRFTAAGVEARLMGALDQESWPVEIQDISKSGARLVQTRRAAAGIDGILILARPDRQNIVQIDVQLVYVLADPSGRFVLGVTFKRLLTDEEMRKLL